MSKLSVNQISPFSGSTVGVGSTPTESSALMEMISTNKGVIFPRMSGAQRDAIVSPANGLTIYNTDTKRIESFDGANWSGSPLVNVITISGPGTNLIGSAIAAITDADPTNPYLIMVGPGVFTEAPFTMKAYVSVQGSGEEQTVIAASNPTTHLITGADFSSLSHCQVGGVTTSGFAAIYHNSASGTTNTAFWVEHVRFGANDTLVKTVGSSGASNVFIVNCKFGGINSFNTGFYALAIGSVASKVVVRNSNTTGLTAPYPADVFVAEGLGSEIVLNSVQVRSAVTTTGNCLRLSNGGSTRAIAVNVKGFGKGLYVPAGGDDPVMHVGSFLCDENTIDIDVQHTGATGCITACVQEAKVQKAFDALVSMNLLDNQTGDLLQSGNVKLQQQGDGFVDITTLSNESSTMGVIEGGELSYTSGLTVNVAAGFGYLEIEPERYFKIMWDATSIDLDPSEVVYLYFDSTGTLLKSSSVPDIHSAILLGRAISDATQIIIVDENGISAEHSANSIDEILRRAIGAVYESGSVVTEVGTRGLAVTSGRYYLSTRKFEPVGGNPISWTRYIRDGSGGFLRASQSTVDNANYDNNAGTPTALTATFYAKHTLYTIGQGALEQYLLVYAQAQYATLSEVETAERATPPGYFDEGIVPIASLVVRQGTSSIIEVIDERPRIGFSPSAVASTSDHGSLSGLLDDDHPQYIRTDGTRAFTGNQSLGGFNLTSVGTVNGVVVEAHASRHNPGGADAVSTAAPTTTLSPATTNAAGSGTSLSKNDHTHAVATALVADITTIQPDDAAAAGTSDNFARGNHKHAIVTAAPTTTLSPATSNAEGVGTSFPRNDHTHAIATALVGDITTIQPDDAASAGSTDNFARGNHKHAIATDVAVSISTSSSNAEGSSSSFAKADHTHAVTVSNSQATATADDTTTSTTDVLINSMTLTPASGTYLAIFTSSATNSGNGSTRNIFSIYSGGAQFAASETPMGISGGSNVPVTCQAVVTVNGSQAIEARWRVAAGTGTVHQRILTVLKLF